MLLETRNKHKRSHPVLSAVLVSPSDTDVLNGEVRGFTVAGAGDVAVRYLDGTSAVLPARLAGVDYAHMIDMVLATGTTATGIVVLY